MSIDLSELPIRDHEMVPVEVGGWQQGFAADHYVGRNGDRWAARFTTARMPVEPHGRRFASLLRQAMKEGGVVPLPLDGVEIGAPGLPVVASVPGPGKSLPVSGLTPGYAVKVGFWVSVIHAGQRYLDSVAEPVIAAANGTATVVMENRIRVPYAAGDVVEIGRARIEGAVIDIAGFPAPLERFTAFSFTVRETR